MFALCSPVEDDRNAEVSTDDKLQHMENRLCLQGEALMLPIGPKVVPFWGSYLYFYKVIPKRNYFGAYG